MMKRGTISLIPLSFFLAACVSESPDSNRKEKVMMDGFNVCEDIGGAGELIAKINSKFAASLDDLYNRSDGPAFAARLSQRIFQQEDSILNVLETSAKNCISSPVSPDMLARARKSRDEAKASYDDWMKTAPELFMDEPRNSSEDEVLRLINLLASIATAYSRAQAAAYVGPSPRAGYSGTSTGTATGCGNECVVSDARLKVGIESIGVTEHGLFIYEFSYLPETGVNGRFRGVIAQDLLNTQFADAVFLSDSGYFKVDYSKLPITFARLK